MRRFRLDSSGIPTGEDDAFGPIAGSLAAHSWDDGFELPAERPSLRISGGGTGISVDLLEGYRYAQVYAPADRELVALEPMTAATSALTSGRGLTTVPAGGRYRAAFRIRVEAVDPERAGSKRKLLQ
jgi:galactose mutarotase-like enzyme